MTLLPARPNNSLVGPRMHVSVLIDKSTSMERIRSTVERSFNDYLDTLQEQPAEIRASVGMFGDHFEVHASGVPLMQVPHLTRETYQPDGNTRLYDSLAEAITTLTGQLAENDRALVVVVTDGADNLSTKYDEHAIAALVQARRATGRWTFIYIGPNRSTGVDLGFTDQLLLGTGAAGFAEAMGQLSAATTQLLLSDGR